MINLPMLLHQAWLTAFALYIKLRVIAVRSKEKSVLDAGSTPAWSTIRGYMEEELVKWLVGVGAVLLVFAIVLL